MTLIEALKLSRSVYRPINNCRLEFDKQYDEVTFLCRICLNDILATDWEPIIERKTKEVWQWRVRNEHDRWELDKHLLDENEAESFFSGCIFQKHAGPFEVLCD